MWHPQGQALWHRGQGAAGLCAAVATQAQDRSHFVGVCDGAEQEAESSKPRSSWGLGANGPQAAPAPTRGRARTGLQL